jgi:hypothetical protein
VKGAAALVLVAACAADEPDEALEHRFSARPMMLIASSELAAECLANLEAVVLWYREHGATLTLDVLDPLAHVLNGFVVGGQVGIVPGRLNANVRGQTRIALTAGGDIFGAEITLAFCDALSVAHECGHALGLVHVGRWDNLMYPAIDHGGWDLDDQQLAFIEDETLGTLISYATATPLRWEDLDDVVVITCGDE